MSLTFEYQRQFKWRDWGTAIARCPIKPHQKVLDLGCGLGDLSVELSKRGAVVTGVDSNKELLDVARTRNARSCSFLEQELSQLNLKKESFDGIWCSFTAAYFTNFSEILSQWVAYLKPDSWICVVEMDDLFGHTPMSSYMRDKVEQFYSEAFDAKRYDFLSGHKVATSLKNEGFKVETISLKDKELAFEGPTDPEVLQAWSDRLDRMFRLQEFLGTGFNSFRSEFLKSLTMSSHKSNCKVLCSVGIRSSHSKKVR